MDQSDLLVFKNATLRISPVSDVEWDFFESSIREKKIFKNDFFVKSGNVCNTIGFVLKGVFRTYYIDQSGEEITTHFSLENNFIVDYVSFLTTKESVFYIEALEDSKIFFYTKDVVDELFRTYHNWEQFGRIIAEQVFIQSQKRFHSLLLKSAEERYLDLLKDFPEIFQRVPQYLIASYLGIQAPSLSRIRKNLSQA